MHPSRLKLTTALVLTVTCSLIAAAQPALGSSLTARPQTRSVSAVISPLSGSGVVYGGSAYAVRLAGVSVEGVPISDAVLGATGQLPGNGGTLSAAAGTLTLPGGLGSLAITGAGVTGGGGTAASSAQVAGLNLLPNVTAGGAGLCLPLLGCLSNVSGGTSALVGGVLHSLLGGGGSTGSSSRPASNLADVGLARSAASAAVGNSPAHSASTDVGTISLFGGAVNVPINPGATSNVNLGLLDITLNQRSYDSSTNTASAQAVVLDFPANGLLSSAIAGTITVASSTAVTTGTPSCPSGVTVTGVSPSSGPVAGGTPVTITGTGFGGGIPVAFGTIPATQVAVESSGTIQATSPPSSAGTINISVGNCPALSAPFAYTSSPPVRESGGNRIQTAIDISQSTYPGAGSAGAVVITTDLNFPDALAGVPLAAHFHGPLLLTEPPSERDQLDPAVLAEIQRVLTPNAGKPVYLLGGSAALAPAIATILAGLGYHPIALSGPNRVATAVTIADAVGNPTTAFLATGLGFGDALSAGPAAVHQSGVVLLSDGSTMPPATAAYLSAHPHDLVFAVGGPAAAADPSAIPVAGASEFATDTLVATFFGNRAMIGVARGDMFPDALDGGAQAAADGGPIILVNPTLPLPAASAAYFSANAPDIQASTIYGGSAAIDAPVLAAIAAALDPAG